jgi:hypothetical protein
MKKFINFRKSKLLLLTLLAFVAGASPTWADELTVNDGTATNAYIPLYGNYADTQGTRSEFILSEDMLSEMNGDITQMTFEMDKTYGFSATYQVYLKTVDQAEFTYENYKRYFAGIDGSTTVYEGTLTGSSSTDLVVTFTTPFKYTGGNLLVGFLVTTAGTYANASFKGVDGSYCGLYSKTKGATTGDNVNFMPKVTFEYTASGIASLKKPGAVTASNITASSATISWTAGGDETSWEISYSTDSAAPAEDGSYTTVSTNSYGLTGLTAGTNYYVYVRAVDGDNKSKWSSVCSFTPGVLTINNTNTTTNTYVPIYGYDMDNYKVKSQFVLPASSLASLNGTQITKIVFYGTDSRSALSSNTFDVYMAEVNDASISSLVDWSTLETVYSGSLSISDGKMTIALPDGFDYSGGNLLIGFLQTGGTSWTNLSWTGVSATGTALSGSSSVSQRNFLPQMSFYYAAQTTTVKKPKNLAASEVATTTATLGWTDGEEGLSAWEIAYSDNADFAPDTEGTKVEATANPFTLTELTPATTYYAYVRAKKGEDYSKWSNKVEFTTLSAAPVMVLSTTSINFGLVSDAAAQAQTFTVTNEGGAAMNAFSVKPAGEGFSVSDTEGNELPQTIAPGESVTVKVTMNALGSHTDELVITAGGEVAEQRVTLTGYMLDNTKIAETFASLPDRWTAYAYKSGYSTYNWSYSADGAYNQNENSTLTSPKLTVAEGETLLVYAKLKSSATYGYIQVEGSADNGETWTAYTKKLDYEAFGSTTNEFQAIVLSDVPAAVNKLRFKSYYAYLNAINGFTYAADPVLALYSDENCTATVANEVSKSFGFVTEDQSQSYYIKNNGTGQIELTAADVDGFSVNIVDNALTAGESTAVTITMPATEGQHDAAIVITAKNHDTDEVLGTFTVNATGMLRDASKFYQEFAATAIPAGWSADGTWYYNATNGAYTQSWYLTNNARLKTPLLTIAEGETIAVEAKGLSTDNTSYQHLQLQYSTDGTNWTNLGSELALDPSNWNTFMVTWPAELEPGKYYIGMLASQTCIRMFYGGVQNLEPIINFAAADYNFGMVSTATTTNAYTINNEGTAALENLSVTCDNDNFTVAVADDASEIAVGAQATFTVTLNTAAMGSQNGTITISGDGITPKTFNVSGYVVDNTQIYTSFTAAPDNWENSGWTFSATGATAGYNSNATLTSPKINVAEGQKLAISARLQSNNSYYYVRVEGYNTESAEWTQLKNMSNDVLNSSTFTVVEISDIPTTVNRIRLVGNYAIVNGFNGFTLNDNDPQFAVYSNEACTNAITATTATNAWGFVSEDKSATYYIKNVGTGTMTLTQTDAPAGFTAVLGKTSLGAGESTALTISMANNVESNEGYHAGDVVLTATDNADNTLGTFTVTSSGVVVGSKTDINFATLDAFPAGWEATNWTLSDGKASITYNNGTLTTGTYTVAEGESLIVEARRNSSSSYATIALNYSYSTDGGATWSQAKSITPASTAYELIAISDIPAGDVVIKFTGTYVDIDRIYGYTAVSKANIALDKTADYDFGMQTTDADYVITVTNNGTAEMTGLTATLTTGTDYTVAVSKTSLAVNETATVTVTQKFDASKGLASLADVLTITADGLAGKTINLSGKTRDASKWYVDFADGTIPATFVEKGTWTASSQYAANNNSAESSLITQPITVAAGEKIQFDAKNPYGGSLKVRYSIDGGISWSEYTDYTDAIGTSAFTAHTLDLQNNEEKTAVIEFCGRYYVQLDNIYGGTPNATAPMMAVKKSGTAVESGVTEAFGAIKDAATATYTITNVGNGTLTITDPVTVTGAATAAVSATSLTNGQSATLTITMPVATPYGAKEGVVTVKTSLGDFVINYNATVLNPNALDEQFASGKPAGWYFGGYWEVSSQQAENTASSVADLITEQLTVAGESDALTFQAARTTGNNAPTFRVYTSQNRVDWTEVDLGDLTLTTAYQDVAISGLAAGDYYVRISGARVKVDNFLGWTKKNNTHDLYVTATTFPTATQDGGATIETSATVTSLIAAEEGVYAKLFIDGKKAETAEAATISLNGTQTFSMSYTLPTDPGTLKAQIKVYYSDGTEAFATAEKDVKVYYALDETVAPEGITAGTFDVKLTHEFVEGWNTVCLPFETPVSIFNGSTVDAVAYQFAGYDVTSKELTFTKVTTLEAGKPYVVYTPAGVESIFTLSNCEVTATEAKAVSYNDVKFQGSYAPMDSEALSGCYGLTAAGKIAPASATATMKGFRGYFTGVPANARVTFIGDETPTGISSITIDPTAEGVFNLNGQKVETLRKGGLYIVNGKKTVVK